MVCKKCGCPLDEGVRFCTQCGAKVEADEPVAAAEETPVTTEAPVKAPEPAAAAEQPAEAAQAPEVEAAAPEAPIEEVPEVEPVAEAAEIAEAVVAEDTDVTEAEATAPVADAVEIAEAVVAGETEPGTPVPPTNCAVCGAELTAGVQFCPSCGTPVPQPVPKKRKIWPWLVGAAALVALCVVLVVCLLPKKGPFSKLEGAFENTFTASYVSGTLTIRGGGLDYTVIDYTLVPDPQEPVLIVSSEGTTMALYQQYLLTNVPGYGTFKQDMSEQFAEYFDALENYEAEKDETPEIDFEDVHIRDILNALDDSGELLATLEEGMDIEILNQCVHDVPKRFNDEAWLKEATNYTETKDGKVTTYGFAINARSIEKFLEIFQPAFLDPADYTTVTGELAKMTDEDLNVSISLAVEGDYLTAVVLRAAVDGETMEIALDFSEVSQTPFDTTELDAWMAEAFG